MQLSFVPFILSLLLSQHLLSFSKINKQGFLARITSEYFDNVSIIIPTLGNGWQ